MQQWAPHTVQIMKNNTPLGLVLVPCQAGCADQGHELTSGLFTGVSNRAIKTKAGPCSSFVSAQTAHSGVAALLRLLDSHTVDSLPPGNPYMHPNPKLVDKSLLKAPDAGEETPAGSSLLTNSTAGVTPL